MHYCSPYKHNTQDCHKNFLIKHNTQITNTFERPRANLFEWYSKYAERKRKELFFLRIPARCRRIRERILRTTRQTDAVRRELFSDYLSSNKLLLDLIFISAFQNNGAGNEFIYS